MNGEYDTIAAIATPPGRGGVSIVKISGHRSLQIAMQIAGQEPQVRVVQVARFRNADGILIDQGLLLYFKGPASYTGEDVVEIHGHGGAVVPQLLLDCVIRLGARHARPGEFTERAFLNGKLDLAQAEAVVDLIESRSVQAAKMAIRSLQGYFSDEVRRLSNALLDIRVHVEGVLDFPEEDPALLADGAILDRLLGTRQSLERMLENSRKGQLFREAVRVVIIGRPNVGKSSLLNRLSGSERAIVMATPGTTRDVIEQSMFLDGLQIEVVDTAGVHETEDPVEREGVRRTLREMENADLILLISDSDEGLSADRRYFEPWLDPDKKLIQVRNKIDLDCDHAKRSGSVAADRVFLSARTGNGLPLLMDTIREAAGLTIRDENVYLARSRHIEALQQAGYHLGAAYAWMSRQSSLDLAAEELLQAHQCLGRITGEIHSDELLGEIFSRFCIGK
ncbi:MAG: tRNA uridine-5-carboxymethylaminomethyl(34) synthesis GTPase MnmE [Gammaproteobacteria bacterium RIFCSPLOWO2_02_FULL_56_15]|nr:MAG: tRNA uridine-5-carboxymethylaminomethyl(34) synthesis GTPase MnmE [Gammaproteobacteria bacterium RIFCSPLOWO2_02_FULL_56_15]